MRPFYIGSRTHLFWARRAEGVGYTVPLTLKLTDLEQVVTADIGTQPALVLTRDVTTTARQMLPLRSRLIYAPQGPSVAVPPEPPYNEQFFVKGRMSPVIERIDQASLQKNEALAKFAILKKAKTVVERAVVQVENNDVHAVASRNIPTQP